MTASLARLLRQSISNEDEVVPIANEVEYARGYLTIQKMRYKDKLEFQIEVDSSILYIPLIKLVLQPIIENAIYHGLKYKESKGLLIVKGFMKDGNAVLQVIDDGVGMDEETLAHIYDKHKVNYHSNGVGVYNVQKRLKVYYGEELRIPVNWVKEQLQRSQFQADRRDRYEKEKMAEYLPGSLSDQRNRRWHLVSPEKN